jgi:hypothetical protein
MGGPTVSAGRLSVEPQMTTELSESRLHYSAPAIMTAC